MKFLVMMNSTGEKIIHIFDEEPKKELIYEILGRYYELGFMWESYLVISRY